MATRDKEHYERALQVLSRIQRTLVKRLTDFVIANESGMRQAAEGSDGYGFVLQQVDELFLSRLNLIERTIGELHKYPIEGASKYRTLCFSVARDTAEQAINTRLEKIPTARVLGIFTSPAAVRLPQVAEAGAPEPLADENGDLLVTVLYYGPTQAPEL
jgi:hypothetical protein